MTNARSLANFATGIGTEGAVLTVDNTNNRIGIATTNPQNDLQVGAGITMEGDPGDAIFAGVVTAASFVTSTLSQLSGDVGIADSIFHIGDDNTAIRFPGNDTFTIETAGTERLRVESGGDVGIGTVNPARVLHTLGDLVRFDNDGPAAVILVDHNNEKNFRIVTNTSSSHSFSIQDMGDSVVGGGTDRLTIDSSGNVGVGTVGPETPRGNQGLEVAGSTGAEIVATRADTDTADGDFIGAFIFKSRDNGGTPPHYAGMYAKANGTAGSMDLHFSGDRDRYENDNSDLTIRSGNIGIGTDNPSQQKLTIDVNSSGTTAASFDGINIANTDTTDNNGAAICFGQSITGNSNARLGVIHTDRTTSSEDQDLFIGLLGGGSYEDRFRITSTGNIRVGSVGEFNEAQLATGHCLAICDTSDSAQLQIRGGSPKLFFDATSGGNGQIYADSTALDVFSGTPNSPGTRRIHMDNSGDVGIGTVLGNARLAVRLNSGGLQPGEAVLNACLGNDSTMVGGILVVENVGNRGSRGHASGSPLANFKFTDQTGFLLDKSGNIGIGTDSPTTQAGRTMHLHNSDGQQRIHLTNQNSGFAAGDGLDIIMENNSDADAHILNHDGMLKLGANDNAIMHLKNADAVCTIFVNGDPVDDKTILRLQNGTGSSDIGTQTSHIDFAFVDSNANVTPQARISATVGDGSDANTQVKEGKGFLTFHCSNTTFDSGDRDPAQRLKIAHDGTFTGSSSADISDQRLKENIATITDPITKVKALTGRTFTWKDEADMRPGTHYGFVAQEVESVIPDVIVSDTGIRVFDADGNLQDASIVELPVGGEYAKSVNSAGIIPVLVEALKETLSKVETLETQNTAQQTQIDDLLTRVTALEA